MRKLAKRLVSPDLVCPDHWSGPDYVLTDGPAVADLCAAADFAPDPQQELGLDLIFAVGENGLPAAFSFGVVCCRQNLKTGLFKQAAIGWLYVTDERKVVWSAHEMPTTLDAQKELGELLLDAPALAKRMLPQKNHGIYADNGSERIELATGQQIRFKARTNGGGRGLSGDKVILDEAFALKPAHVGSLLPTMTARPNGQVLYGSSAGALDSAVLRDVRDRGRAGTSERMYYLEWLAPREPCRDARGKVDPDCLHPKDALKLGLDCALDREHLIRSANPTITTGRISIQTIRDLRQELPPEEYMRESLGWWEDPEDGASNVFGAGRWDACAGELEEMPEAPAAIGVAVSVDQDWGSIAAATPVELLEDPEDTEAEPVERTFVTAVDRREGVEWLIAEVKRIQDETDCRVLIDAKGPAKDLVKDFEDNDVAVDLVSLDEYAEACARVYRWVRSRQLLHPSSTELDEAVDGAIWRTVGDRRVWGRRQSVSDVSMLEAATLAVHGAEQAGTFNVY